MDKIWIIANADIYENEVGDSHLTKPPRFVHERREAAETELLRLKNANPDADFIMFEAMAFAERDQYGVVRMREIAE